MSRFRSSAPTISQDSGYFRAKLVQEQLIKGSPIPYTLIRATQFLEFIRSIAQAGTTGDTVRLSHSLFQPMAAETVATSVAEAALAAPTERHGRDRRPRHVPP